MSRGAVWRDIREGSGEIRIIRRTHFHGPHSLNISVAQVVRVNTSSLSFSRNFVISAVRAFLYRVNLRAKAITSVSEWAVLHSESAYPCPIFKSRLLNDISTSLSKITPDPRFPNIEYLPISFRASSFWVVFLNGAVTMDTILAHWDSASSRSLRQSNFASQISPYHAILQ